MMMFVSSVWRLLHIWKLHLYTRADLPWLSLCWGGSGSPCLWYLWPEGGDRPWHLGEALGSDVLCLEGAGLPSTADWSSLSLLFAAEDEKKIKRRQEEEKDERRMGRREEDENKMKRRWEDKKENERKREWEKNKIWQEENERTRGRDEDEEDDRRMRRAS